MRLLLDTHTLLWWHESHPNLSKRAADALTDPSNAVYFSVINIWEAQIKASLGKLTLRDPLPDVVDRQHRINGFGLLAVHAQHVYRLEGLATHHKDPFDRLLIAQALHEGLTLVTGDGVLSRYAVPVLW